MPRPQAGTPTGTAFPLAGTPMNMAVADVDAVIRLGIEGHSVRTGGAPVKAEQGERMVKRPLPPGRERTRLPGSMPGKGVNAKRFLAAILAIAIFGLPS